MTKLPSLFHEDFKASKRHNKTLCYVMDKESIEEQLDSIFNKNEPLYSQKVWIETKGKSYATRIMERRKTELITINRETIPIKELKSIKRIS